MFPVVVHTVGRGGEHAYWPPDTNLIDRSSIDGSVSALTVLLLD